MAVQKSKKSRAKRGTRRAHDSLTNPALAIDKQTGEVHRRHHVTKDGFYKGRQVTVTKEDSTEADE